MHIVLCSKAFVHNTLQHPPWRTPGSPGGQGFDSLGDVTFGFGDSMEQCDACFAHMSPPNISTAIFLSHGLTLLQKHCQISSHEPLADTMVDRVYARSLGPSLPPTQFSFRFTLNVESKRLITYGGYSHPSYYLSARHLMSIWAPFWCRTLTCHAVETCCRRSSSVDRDWTRALIAYARDPLSTARESIDACARACYQ